MKSRPLASLFSALLFISLVGAQTTIIVKVGEFASAYDSRTVSAALNDTVTFVFLGPFHTVTQSSFEAPCVPLPGGFNSGVAGRGTDDSTGAPTWSLKITNVSEPIWYFCEVTTPVSHCESGMVGAINPPSQAVFTQYLMAAEQVTATPSPVVSVALSGVGAFATAAPSIPTSSPVSSTATSASASSAPPASASTTTTSATNTPSAPPPVTRSRTKNHLGVIIGAVVGGVVGGLFIIGALIWCLRYRNTKKRRESIATDDSRFFRYHVPVRTPSDAFRAAKASENLHSNGGTPPQPSSNLLTRDSSPDLARPLSPVRRGQVPVPPISRALPTPAVTSPATVADNQPANAGAPPGVQTSNIDMQSLANEVAQVIIRSTSGNTLNAQMRAQDSTGAYTRPQSMRIANPSGDTRVPSTLLDPPAYRRQAGVNSPAAEKATLSRE